MIPAFFATVCSASAAFASSYPIDGVEPLIQPNEAKALSAAGVTTTQALVERGATPKARKELATTTRIPEKRLLQLVHMADLMRVSGIGPKMVRLLGKAGIATLSDLAKQDGAKLAASIEKLRPSLDSDLKEKLPDKETLSHWIGQAKALKPLVK